jgi:hypothetical protein
MKVERVTVSFEVSRSRNYQSVKYSLSEVLVLEEGEDRWGVMPLLGTPSGCWRSTALNRLCWQAVGRCWRWSAPEVPAVRRER